MHTGKPALAHAAPDRDHYNIVIVGSGMGGGTLAYALKDSGASVLLVERGDFLPRERENWSVADVFGRKRYQNAEQWYDPAGKPFDPGTYYYVGGNTKFYGASLARFRRSDFQAVSHADGVSPGWFMSYDELAPFYDIAERIYRVHGDQHDDPTLTRDRPFPFPAVSHEPSIGRPTGCAGTASPPRTSRSGSTCSRGAPVSAAPPATASRVCSTPSPTPT